MQRRAPLSGRCIGPPTTTDEAIEPTLLRHPFHKVKAIFALVNVVVPRLRLTTAGTPTVLRNHRIAVLCKTGKDLFKTTPAVRRTHNDSWCPWRYRQVDVS